MPAREQVLRFAVGSPDGPRSRTWRLWVPPRKSDVYVSSRRVANSAKVSLHEPGPARFALTREFVRMSSFKAPEGRDSRLAVEWERPRPKPPAQIARPLALLVPWDEVVDRGVAESGNVLWTPSPPEGTCVHFDLVYTPSGVTVEGHPGARSMGTQLVGKVELENGELVFVTSVTREMGAELRTQVETLRSATSLDRDGKRIEKTGMLAFGTEPNPDAQDGTFVGTVVDVTRADEGPDDTPKRLARLRRSWRAAVGWLARWVNRSDATPLSG